MSDFIAPYFLNCVFLVERCRHPDPGRGGPNDKEHSEHLPGQRHRGELQGAGGDGGRVGNSLRGRQPAGQSDEGGREGVGQREVQKELWKLCSRRDHEAHAVCQRPQQGLLQRKYQLGLMLMGERAAPHQPTTALFVPQPKKLPNGNLSWLKEFPNAVFLKC